MPKETIYSRYVGDEPNPPHVHVGWDNGCEQVQVATLVSNGKIFAWDEAKQCHVEIVTDRPGWFVQLDRAGINDLIRMLRRARDGAFGADA